MTLKSQIEAIATRVSKLEHEGDPKVEFLRRLLPAEAKRWQRRVDAALAADPADPAEAEYEAQIWMAQQIFNAVPAVERSHPETQAAIYIMYVEGVFGPVFNGEGEPTEAERTAIARADRVAAGLPPE
jgi:hypothetical protein